MNVLQFKGMHTMHTYGIRYFIFFLSFIFSVYKKGLFKLKSLKLIKRNIITYFVRMDLSFQLQS